MICLLYTAFFHQEPVTLASAPPQIAAVQEAPRPDIAPLAELIGRAESDTVGGYNAANNGRAMGLGKNGLVKVFGRDAKNVTIAQVKHKQNVGALYAVGRYQMIPTTLRAAQKWANLPDSATFGPQNQDKLFLKLLKYKRPTVWDFLNGRASLSAAVQSLAREWAGVPTLSGRSFYRNGNKANVSVSQVKKALVRSRGW